MVSLVFFDVKKRRKNEKKEREEEREGKKRRRIKRNEKRNEGRDEGFIQKKNMSGVCFLLLFDIKTREELLPIPLISYFFYTCKHSVLFIYIYFLLFFLFLFLFFFFLCQVRYILRIVQC